MELKTIEGIIVGEKPYGETSKILTIITKEYGIINVLSKGSKRLKSNLRSVSSVFTYANFEVSYKEDKLSTLISADIINSLNNIKKDTSMTKISYLNFICELTKQVIRQSNDKNIFEMFIASILKINEGYDPVVITNILELKYLRYLGINLKLDGCIVCDSKNVVTISASKGGFVCKKHIENEYIVSDKAIKLIKLLEYVDISKITKLDIKEETKKEINDFINEYYDRYSGLYLKSKDFLKSLQIL